MNALVAGASGLVGGELLRRLLADADNKVVSVGRRAIDVKNDRLEQVTVDFSKPDTFSSLATADVAFCCLGTTIKKAGSKEAFRAVDLDALVTFAKAAKAKDIKTFVHVTALGANPKSMTFYNQVKGEAEAAIAEIGFESVYALRPSFLDGNRAESRPLENVAIVVARAFGPLLGKLRPTRVDDVVTVMLAKAKAPAPGVHVVEADEINAAGKK